MARKAKYRVFPITGVGRYAIETYYSGAYKRYGMPIYTYNKLFDFIDYARSIYAHESEDYEVVEK